MSNGPDPQQNGQSDSGGFSVEDARRLRQQYSNGSAGKNQGDDQQDLARQEQEIAQLLGLSESEQPQPQSEYGATSFDEGLEAGWEGLKAGAQYTSGEIAGMVGADETKDRWQEHARENIESAPRSDDSWGYFLGSLVPSTVPSAAAIAAAPFTGGSTLPMAASIGALSFSSAGNGMMEYESYKKQKGQQVDPLSKLAVGVAYGGFEAAAERFSLGKLMPRGLGSDFLMKGNVEAAEKVGRDMLDTFAKANPSRYQAITRQVRTGMGAEGLEEVATEIGQASTELMYQEGDDRMETIKQLPANMFTAFTGGSLMGAALGPLSYASQQKVHRDRRKEQGGVVLAENSSDGQTYELVAPVQTEQQRGYQALDPQGNEQFIPEGQVGQVTKLTVPQFDKLLQDKLDTQQFELSQRDPVTVATYQGQEVQVKGQDGEGGYYITVTDSESGEPRDVNVGADQLENIQQIPPAEQMAAEGNPPTGQPTVPDEDPEQQGRKPIQDENGDFIMPGAPGYEQALQRQRDIETDEQGVPTENQKRTLTLGTGTDKQQVVLASQEAGGFRVESRTTTEDGQPVVQQVGDMTVEEANELESNLQSHYDARYKNTDQGVQVQAVPSDPADPSSPMEVRITPEGQQQAETRQEEAGQQMELTEQQQTQQGQPEVQQESRQEETEQAPTEQQPAQQEEETRPADPIIQKAREDFEQHGVATKNYVDRYRAIQDNFGQQEADRYQQEVDRLVEQAIQQRTQQEESGQQQQPEQPIGTGQQEEQAEEAPETEEAPQPQETEQAESRYQARQTEEGIEVTDTQSGETLDRNTAQRDEAVGAFVAREFSDRPTLEDAIRENPEIEQDAASKPVEEAVADYSENPIQIASEIERRKTRVGDLSQQDDDIIKTQFWDAGRRIPFSDFAKFSDENLADPYIKINTRKDGMSAEQISQNLDMNYDIQMTPEEVVRSFIDYYENIRGTGRQTFKDETLNQLSERFTEITGERYDGRLGEVILREANLQELGDPQLANQLEDVADEFVDDQGNINYNEEIANRSPAFRRWLFGETTEEQDAEQETRQQQPTAEQAEQGLEGTPDDQAQEGAGQESPGQQRAGRGRERINQILEGEDVPPLEDDPEFNPADEGRGTVEQQRRIYGQTKQYSGFEGPGGNRVGYLSAAREGSLGDDPSAQGELQFGEAPEGEADDIALPDDFYVVKRGYRPDQRWNLTGRNSEIRNIGDVAYLMRALEDAATEHIFVVAVGEEGENLVQHISSGTDDASLVDPLAIQQIVNDVNPTDLYFVHNHPSGRLQPSKADREQFEQIDEITDGTVHGMIMDAYRGEYAIFGGQQSADEVLQRPTDPGQDVPYEVQRFDRQIYGEPVESGSLTGPEEVAGFLTGARYSIGDKTVALLMDNAMQVNGAFQLTDLSRQGMVDQLTRLMPQYNSNRVILAGRDQQIDVGTINQINEEIPFGGIADYVMVETSEGNLQNYRSIRQQDSVREPGPSFARQQLEEQLDQARKEYRAAQSALENKRQELEQTLEADQENLFGERDVDQENRLFDMRADASQMPEALRPFQERLEVARQQVNRIYKKLEQLPDESDPSLFDDDTRFSRREDLQQDQPRQRQAAEESEQTASDFLDQTTSAHASRLAGDLREKIDGWAGRNQIVVAENPDQLPRDVRNLLELQEGRIGGLYHSGTAYIFTWNLSDAKEADMTLAHEAIGHGGIRGLLAHMSSNRQDFENRLKELSNEIYESFKDDEAFQDIVDSYGLDMRRNDHRREAAEEYIAHLAETNPDASILDKVVKFINDILRELGLSNQITNADIKAMLADARQFMESGTPTTVDAGGQLMRPAFKRSALADIFYGRLGNKIASDLNNKGTPEQFSQTLKAWNRKGEFKTEELEWSGLLEWLDGIEEGPVYRDDVLDFLEGNQIEVQETMLTGNRADTELDTAEQSRAVHYLIDQAGWDQQRAANTVSKAATGDAVAIGDIREAGAPSDLLAPFEGVDPKTTKFSEYTLPGGQNYRELMLTLPRRPQEAMDFGTWFEQNYDQTVEEASGRLLANARQNYDEDLGGTTDAANFQSSHYDEPNILAHVRFNERTDSEGNRILFLEEIQSDWHQAGREQGYIGEDIDWQEGVDWEVQEGTIEGLDGIERTHYFVRHFDSGLRTKNYDNIDSARNQGSEELRQRVMSHGRVPDAPFKSTWHELVIKRMLRYGTEHGFDKVGWTTGQQQADRYDLSEQVQRLEYYPATERLVMISHEGVEIPVEGKTSQDELSDAVGSELSERIIGHIDDGADQVVIEGPDLETGGEGMKTFYNQMIPRFVSKYTKSWDGEVSPIDIRTDKPITISQGRDSGLWRVETEDGLIDSFADRADAEQLRNEIQGQESTEKVLAVDITPDMRRDIMEAGQPLFVRLGNDFTTFENGISSFLDGSLGEGTLLDAGNPSQVLKEAGVPDRPMLVSPHLLRAGQGFGLSDQTLRELPDRLGDPAMVFTGPNDGHHLALVEIEGESMLVRLSGTGQTTTADEVRPLADSSQKIQRWIDAGRLSHLDRQSDVAAEFNLPQQDVRFKRMRDPLEDRPHQFQRRIDKWVRRFQNRTVDIREIQQGVVDEGGTLTDESNTYQADNRSSGKIEAQQEDFKREYEDPLVEQANRLYRETDVTYADINQYLKARHAPERNEYLQQRNPDGGPAQSGMSDQQAAEIMDRMQQRGIAEDLEGLAEQADRMSDFVLDKWLESGLISQQRYDALQERFDHYVPMRGFANRMGIDPTIFAGDVSMEGRQSEAGDVLPYLSAMADTAIVAGEKNKVKQHLLEFVRQNWERSDLFRIRNVYFRATGETNEETGKAEYEPTFVEPTTEELLEGTVKRNLDHDTEAANWESEASPFREPASIRVQVDGRPVVIEFTTPHIAQALKKTSTNEMSWVTAQIGRMTRFLRHVITQYSPEFGIRNLFRDSMTGYVNLSIDFDTATANSIVNPKAIGKGFGALRRGIRNGEFDGEWGQAFDEFRQVGAMTGWWNLDQVRDRARDLQQAIEDGGFTDNPYQTSKDQVNKLLGWMDDYNRVLENIVRVSTYKHLTEEGVTNPDTGEAFTPEQAASYAKNLTVNFNRKGTESHGVGSWFIFFNAAVQGIARQAQPFFSDHSRRQWRAAATPMVMSALAFGFIEAMRFGLGQDDDGEYYYDKINEWTRTHNIMIPNMLSDQPDDFLQIPMAYGYNVYWAIGDMLSRAVYGSVSAGDAALELVATAVDAYNPIGTAEGDTALETAGRTFTPTIAKPVVEILSNKDFAGRPIKPEPFPFEIEKPESQQYFPWNPGYLQETAAFLNRISGGDEVTSGGLDVSPEHLEYVVDFLGGGAGKFVTGLVNSEENIRKHLMGTEDLELYDIYEVPFARAHYGKVGSGVASDRFRERQDKIEKLVHRYEHYYDSGQTQKADQLYEANEELMRLETEMKAAREQVSSLYDWLRVLENRPPTEENRNKIDNIEQQIEDTYDSFNRKFNEIEGMPSQTITELIFNGQQ